MQSCIDKKWTCWNRKEELLRLWLLTWRSLLQPLAKFHVSPEWQHLPYRIYGTNWGTLTSTIIAYYPSLLQHIYQKAQLISKLNNHQMVEQKVAGSHSATIASYIFENYVCQFQELAFNQAGLINYKPLLKAGSTVVLPALRRGSARCNHVPKADKVQVCP